MATKALLTSIEFAEQNFPIEQQRNFIMQKIFEALEIDNVMVR